MAKTLDKLLASSEGKATKLRQKYRWVCTEYDALPGIYEEKKEKALKQFRDRANKKLLPVAFAACDKEAYATCQLEEKLQDYDVKAYLSYREANHKGATAIFQAVKAGADWSGALQNVRAENKNILSKRAAYVQKLEQEKAEFLSKQTAADPAAYEALSKQLESEYQAFSAELDKKYEQQLQKEQAKLQAKLQTYSRKLEELKGSSTYQIPQDVILSVKGLKMYFGGLKAVDDLSFDVKKGEIFGLIGPNGAGKTTVFNCITQFYKPTDGELLFKTKEQETIRLTDYPVHDIVLKGIARTFQNVEVVKEVSVLDNLLIAATRQYTSNLATQMFHLPMLGREEKAIRAKADRILEYMDLKSYRDRICWGLPYGVLKRVEIARVLMCDPQLVILDEPAAGLNESETKELAKLINRIRTDFDCTILLVEHDMGLVMNVCDHICAISFGRMLAYGTAREVQSSKAVQEAYLGTGGEHGTSGN